MSGGWPDKPNFEWREGLIWCCDTLGYVTPSDRWDHVEEAMEAYERRAATTAAEDADQSPPNQSVVIGESRDDP